MVKKNCIYGLVKEYTSNLKERNISICNHISNVQNIDLLIFYQDEYLNNQTRKQMNNDIKRFNKEIIFINVDKYFEMSDENKKIADICITKSIKYRYRPKFKHNHRHYGYMNMCKFYSYDVFNILNELGYTYCWRMDDDIVIKEYNQNLFDLMKKNNLNCIYFRKSLDPHISVLHFCDFMKKICYDRNIETNNNIDERTFYSNSYIVKAGLWKDERIKIIIDKILEEKLFYKEYYGDDIVTANFIKCFSKDEELMFCRKDKLKYYHKSHFYDNFSENTLPLLYNGRCGIKGQVDLWNLRIDIKKLSTLS